MVMRLVKHVLPELLIICKDHGLKLWKVSDLKIAHQIYNSRQN